VQNLGAKLILRPSYSFLILNHLTRILLQQEKIPTTTIDENGVESGKSINSLLEELKIYEFLGRDLTEELKFLLTEPMGLNYRNKICHGLVGESPNSADIYIWWLCLRLTVNNCVLFKDTYWIYYFNCK
jgi:hypothetical protein